MSNRKKVKKNTAKNTKADPVKVEPLVSQRCEGWKRHGGAFTLGPVEWKQCPNKAVVILKVKQPGEKTKDMPSCMECWNEAQDPRWNVKILSARPVATSG